jgi:CheY-like chemotaxis protein
LAEVGYEAILCPDAATAYERIREAAPRAIILDLGLSTDDPGWAVLRRQQSEQHLRRAWELAVQAEDRVTEARQALAASYRRRRRDRGAAL